LQPLDATIELFATLIRESLRCDQITKVQRKSFPADGLKHATALIRKVCVIAGEPTLVADSSAEFAYIGLLDAIQRHDNKLIFSWLIDAVSYQGVSDAIAASYISRHGNVASSEIKSALRKGHACPKLENYWQFEGCGYRKTAASCNRPKHFHECSLPSHNLRNGNLNQAAYSLYLFMRDVAGGDFVEWVDQQLAQADRPRAWDRAQRLRDAVVRPLRHVYGVSDKVLNMSLAALLLAGDAQRERWVVAGSAMIAIDSLIHNWLTRSGILNRLKASHPYGPQCYGQGGCAVVVEQVARRIDTRQFNPDFPKAFPRFVQKALWRFCAQSELEICNGNRIDDTKRCKQAECALFDCCDRVALNPRKN
jgi:hypothetical protein